MIRKIVIAAVAGTMALSAAACNTVRGAGNDIESVADCADGVEGNC